ncbi:hypothetical protein ABFS83_14G208600 [Erythranthe nasuta]
MALMAAGASSLSNRSFIPVSPQFLVPSVSPSHNYIPAYSNGRKFAPCCRIGSRNEGLVEIRATCPATFGARLRESVMNTVGGNPVVVYSKTWCSYSLLVKSLFERLGVEPLVIELDQLGPQGPQLQRTLKRLTGQHTVPNVFVGGKHIGGCTDTVKLHRKGELEPLLSEAVANK